MSQNLWLPFWINITLLLCAVPTVRLLSVPNVIHTTTIASSEVDSATADEAAPLLGERNVGLEQPSSTIDAPQTNVLQHIHNAVRKLARLASGRRNFQILLCSMFLTALASSDTTFLVQYISKRYSWTFAEAGYVLSAKAIVNFTLLAIIIPRVIRAAEASKTIHSSEIRLNFLGAEASLLASVVGVLCVALAFKFWMLLVGKISRQLSSRSALTVTALIIYALGSALGVFMMSLVKSPLIALPDSEAQDFSIVMMVATLGSLVGAPLMTVLWVQAMNLGGFGLGLPYFVSAVSNLNFL